MHKNIIFYALIYINNHVITSVNYIIMSISTNIHIAYLCGPLGLCILLVKNSIDLITPYWSTFINYIHEHID